MSTQLDPVTGAPLLTPDLGTIDQLPYSVQPVPLQDQTNQPQLGRTYLYPDDVPPVLANLNAMNGMQPDQAQTLHTDGSHRLLVASSGGGGGAVAPLPIIANGNSGINIASHDDYVFDFPGYAYISGISVSCSIYDFTELPDGETHTNTVDFQFYDGWKFHTLPLGGYRSGTTFIGSMTAHEFVSFNYPVILGISSPSPATYTGIQVHNWNVFTVLASVCVVGKLV